MNKDVLEHLLSGVRDGSVSADDAMRELKRLPFADLGFARIDHHRHLRQGLPEAIYGPGKTPEQCVAIVSEMLENGSGPVLLTRASQEQTAAVTAAHPAVHRVGHTLIWRKAPVRNARVAVITAGTADLAVAEECAATLTAQGVVPNLLTDVGVAGIHRLLSSLDALEQLDAAVVIAGMEGALASVIGGIVEAPVIAVPTSAGYGSSFEGITALLAMMSSCAAGVSVVGIDNGFGAATAVLRILGPATIDVREGLDTEELPA